MAVTIDDLAKEVKQLRRDVRALSKFLRDESVANVDKGSNRALLDVIIDTPDPAVTPK